MHQNLYREGTPMYEVYLKMPVKAPMGIHFLMEAIVFWGG
jgi:hypothetical protein